ncbi:MAG: ABC transporter substrate-binding protein [Pseudomonadota bacterium]
MQATTHANHHHYANVGMGPNDEYATNDRSAPAIALRLSKAGGLVLAALLMAASFIAATTNTASAEAPAKYMQRVANQLIAAQRKGSRDAYARVIRSHADIPSIGLYSLGTYRPGLRKADRSQYYSGMVKFISRYAAKEGPKYPVARAVVIGQSGETKSGVYVDSTVTLQSGTSYDVRWFLVRRGKTWKVRDAEVIGFWMSPFLKNLFETYISENGGNPKSLVIALSRQ